MQTDLASMALEPALVRTSTELSPVEDAAPADDAYRPPNALLVIALYVTVCVGCPLGLVWSLLWNVGLDPFKRRHGRNALFIYIVVCILIIIAAISMASRIQPPDLGHWATRGQQPDWEGQCWHRHEW